jgi:hypothetical protein
MLRLDGSDDAGLRSTSLRIVQPLHPLGGRRRPPRCAVPERMISAETYRLSEVWALPKLPWKRGRWDA